jgi:hypothetical protein
MKGQHKASNYLEPSWINLSPSTNILVVCAPRLQNQCSGLTESKISLAKKTRKTPYLAMAHSYLVYCLSIYNCANNTNLNKLKITQKKRSEFYVFGECYVTLDYCIAIRHAL